MSNNNLSEARLRHCFAKEHADWLRAVDFDALPKPHIFARVPLMIWFESHYRHLALHRLVEKAVHANRLLTAEEKSLCLQHQAHENIAAASTINSTVSVAGYLAWRGRATYRFPLYTPNLGRFNPDQMRSPVPRFLFRTVLHSCRTAAYMLPTGCVALCFWATILHQQTKSIKSHPTFRALAADTAMRQNSGDFDPKNPSKKLQDRYGQMDPVEGVGTSIGSTGQRRLRPDKEYMEFLKELCKQATGSFDYDLEPIEPQERSLDWVSGTSSGKD